MGTKGMRFAPYPGKEKLIELYAKPGATTWTVGAELGVAASTVRRWLREVGVVVRSSGAPKGKKPAPQAVEASVMARRKHSLPGRPVVGYKLSPDGYVLLWDGEKQRYVREHRIILEQKLGRKLLPTEDAHHENEDRTDNSPDNLVVQPSRSAHLREHYVARKIDEKGRFKKR